MTSRYETETGLENGSARHPERSVPVSSEGAYDRLTGYAFARRYVGEKIVATIGCEEVGYGSRLLAETARSVVGFANSSEAVGEASTAHSMPNASYQRVDLPKLPQSEDYFDVVVALGMVESLEHPEDLVREIKRVLKQDGVLVISALDKQTNSHERDRGGIERRREMYVSEFQELLERYFGHVQVYRQGAVAGGFVFPVSEQLDGAQVESAQFSLTDFELGAEAPATRSVIAVCGDAEALEGQREQPYLLLDHDRRIFDESEERAEDVVLLQAEIQHMQETEVQAFTEALKVQQSMATQLLARNVIIALKLALRRYAVDRAVHAFNIINGNIRAVQRKGARDTVRGASRRALGLFRQPYTKNRER